MSSLVCLVCPGRTPVNCTEQGILESWFPEIKDVKNTYFCFCPETCAIDFIDKKDLQHQVVELSISDVDKLFPMDPFSVRNPNFCFRPISRLVNDCVLL